MQKVFLSMAFSFRRAKRMSALQIKIMENQKAKTEEEKVKERFKQELNPAIGILKEIARRKNEFN